MSVREHIPDAYFIVCLLENEIPFGNDQYFDEIVLAKDAWEGNFERFIFKHSIVEASTSVKGQFFRYLFNRFPDNDKFIYLDPDTYVYSDFTELKELLQTRPIIVCPHLLKPGNIDMELSSTAHGVYNLGFLAVNNSPEAHSFIDWWAERLYLFCYDDKARGIFTDQKWIDLAPCFFDVEILKHDGYNFAPWSLLGCEVTNNDGLCVNGKPLRFIHFSGYGEVAESCMRKWLPEGDHLFRDLYQAYAQKHDGNNSDKVSQTPWVYDFFISGEKIKKQTRLYYRGDYDVMFAQENPFEFSNRHFKLSPFKNRKDSLKHYARMAWAVAKNEGVVALVKKTVSLLKRSLIA